MSVYGLLRPLLFTLPAETAHGLAVAALRAGMVPSCRHVPDPCLATRAFGLAFPSPIGLAAGFDKNGEVPDAMLAQGFGFVEVGTVTPRPQPGNPHPRLFRLVADRAVINRLGFNNAGLDAMASRLRVRRAAARTGIVGANVGANKDATDMIADYVRGIRTLYGLADYFTVNISSPNTPGLRALQHGDVLDTLLTAVMKARTEAHAAVAADGARPIPILVKIAPDLAMEERQNIAALVLHHGVDGLIVSNTTISRPAGLRSRHAGETGGLSGRPLLALSTGVLGHFYRLTEGRITLIGVGGVASGADAYAKIRAGASLVQLYSALVFEGPGLARRIAHDLVVCLRADGFTSVGEAVGADHR